MGPGAQLSIRASMPGKLFRHFSSLAFQVELTLHLSGPLWCSCPGGEGHCAPEICVNSCPLGPSSSSWGGEIGPTGRVGASNSQAIILHPQCSLSLLLPQNMTKCTIGHWEAQRTLSDIAHRGSLCDPDRREVPSLLVAQSPLESETSPWSAWIGLP